MTTAANISAGPALQLNFWHSFFHELLTLDEAVDLLDDLHRRSVTHLAEEGKLRGVNIARSTATRRELRIYRYSVQWLGESERRKTRTPAHPPVDALLPHHRENFRLHEVADFLRCDQDHVRNLCRDEAITGPKFSERQNRITRAALIRFLQAREINAA